MVLKQLDKGHTSIIQGSRAKGKEVRKPRPKPYILGTN